MTDTRTAFHVTWTLINTHTGEVLIDGALASGPIKSRTLAEQVRGVEQRYRELQDAAAPSPHIRSVYRIVDRRFIGSEYWDEVYDAAWRAKRLAGEIP